MSKQPIAGRVSVVTINGTQREFEQAGRNIGTDYHPAHGATLRPYACAWMTDVKRFYEERLVGVDLTAMRAR